MDNEFIDELVLVWVRAKRDENRLKDYYFSEGISHSEKRGTRSGIMDLVRMQEDALGQIERLMSPNPLKDTPNPSVSGERVI